MTGKESIIKLRELQKYKDVEAAHCIADAILCDVLKEVGYDDVVEEWKKIKKHYA